MFVATVEEGDHFVGGPPTAPCNGIGTPCTCHAIGEVDADQRRLVFTQRTDGPQYDSRYDMAPAAGKRDHVMAQSPAGIPNRT